MDQGKRKTKIKSFNVEETSKIRHNGYTNGHESNYVNGYANGDVSYSESRSPENQSNHRQSLQKVLATQVNHMEENFKSALLQYFDEVDMERKYLVQDISRLQDDIQKCESNYEERYRNDEDKGKLIKRLTSNGKLLVSEIEKLKADVGRFKEKENDLINANEKLIKENRHHQKKLSHLEHEIKIVNEENSYLKVLAEDSRRVKDAEKEMINLENQVIFQQKMCKEYSLELADKDKAIDAMKKRYKELEIEVNNLRPLERVKQDFAKMEDEKLCLEQDLNMGKSFIEELEKKLHKCGKEEAVLRETANAAKIKMVSLNEELEHLKQREVKFERKKEKYVNAVKERDNEIAMLRDENSILQRELDALEKDLTVNKMTMETLKYDDELLRNDLKNYKKKIEDFNASSVNEKAGKRKLEEDLLVAKTKLKHYEDENASLTKKVSGLEEEVYTYQDRNVQLETECESKEAREKELQCEVLSYVKQCSKYEQDLVLANKRLQKASENAESLDSLKLQSEREVLELKDKVKSLEVALGTCRDEETCLQEQVVAGQKRYAKVERQLNEANREADEMKRDNDALYKKFEQSEAHCEHYRNENARLQDNLKESAMLRDELDDKIQNLYREMKDFEEENDNLVRKLRTKTSDLEHTRNDLEYSQKDNSKLKQLLSKAEDEARESERVKVDAKREVTSLEQKLEIMTTDNVDLKNKLVRLKEEVQTGNTELENVQDDLRSLQRKHLKLEAIYNAVEEQRNNLENEATSTRQKIIEVNHKRNEIEEKEFSWKRELDTARDSMGSLERHCEELLENKKELEEQLGMFHREQRHFEEERSSLLRKETMWKERLDNAEKELIVAKQRLTESEDEIWNLKKEKRSIDEQCTRNLEDASRLKRKLEDSENEILRLQDKIHELQDQNWLSEKERRKTADERERDLKESDSLRFRHEELDSQLKILQENVKSKEVENEKLQREMEDCLHQFKQNELQIADYENRKHLADDEIDSLRDEIKQLLGSCHEKEDQINKLLEELREEKTNNYKLERDIGRLNLEKDELAMKLDTVLSNVTDLENMSSEKMKENGKMSLELIQLEKKAKSLEAQCMNLEREKNGFEKQMKILEEIANDSKEDYDKQIVENKSLRITIQNYEEKLGQSSEQMTEADNRAKNTENELMNYKNESRADLDNYKHENKYLKDENEKLNTRVTELQSTVESQRATLHQIECQLAVKEEKLLFLDNRNHELSKSRAIIEGKLLESQNVNDFQRQRIGQLSKQIEEVSVDADFNLHENKDLQREIDTLKDIQVKTKEEKKEAEQRSKDLQELLKAEENEKETWLTNTKKVEKQLEETRNELRQLEEDRKSKDEQLRTMEDKYSSLVKECNELAKDKETSQQQIEIAEKEFDDLQQELTEILQKYNRLTDEMKAMKGIKDETEILWENEKNLRSGEREQLLSDINDLQRKLVDLELENGRMEHEKEENEKSIQEMSDTLNGYVKLLQQSQNDREGDRHRYIDEIQDWEKKFEDYEISGKERIQELEIRLKELESVKEQTIASYEWKLMEKDQTLQEAQTMKEERERRSTELHQLENKLASTWEELHEKKMRLEEQDTEIFKLKAQLDWVEEDRKECESVKRALQDDFNKCVEELDMTRSRMTEANVNGEQLKQNLARLQKENERLTNDLETSKSALSDDMQERLKDNAKLTAANEDLKKRLEEEEKASEELEVLKSRCSELEREKVTLQDMVDKQPGMTQPLFSENEELKKQKYEKDLLVSQLEAVARERRQLDRQLTEKEEMRTKLQEENEALKRDLEKLHVSTRQESNIFQDEKSALKNELSDVYMNHQRDLEKIEKMKQENHKLSRDFEQLKRELSDKNKELEKLKTQVKQKKTQEEKTQSKIELKQEKPSSKREVSSIYFQPEFEPISVTLKQTEVRFSEQEETKDAEFTLSKISNNPFLSLDKARSRSVDDLLDDKDRTNPFVTTKNTPREKPRSADTSAMYSKPRLAKSDSSGFSMLSDDLRASVESLDSVGYQSDENDEKRPTKEYVNRLVASFEGGKREKDKTAARKPKVDIYT